MILKDAETTCPVCGGETVDAGTPEMEKQNYENDKPIVIRRRPSSCIGVLFGIALAAALGWFAYKKIASAEIPNNPNAEMSNKMLNVLKEGPRR